MPKAYHIVQWGSLYETSETRKYRNLSFYAKQNKLVGLGIGRTLQHPRGLELLGVWALLEALASLAPQHQRGWIVRNNQPLSAAEIAWLLRIPEEPVKLALEHFSSTEIGWLELADFDPDSPASSPAGVRTPEDSPASSPAGVRTPEDSPLRGEDKRMRNKRREKREKSMHTPTVAVVRAWAEKNGVDPDFAQLKLEQAVERGDFEKSIWRRKWESKFARFWKEDGEVWKARKKTAPPAGANKPGVSLESMRSAA
jgi:hypothetical protein